MQPPMMPPQGMPPGMPPGMGMGMAPGMPPGMMPNQEMNQGMPAGMVACPCCGQPMPMPDNNAMAPNSPVPPTELGLSSQGQQQDSGLLSALLGSMG